MGFRAVKPRRWFVARDIQALVRSHDSAYVTIVRTTRGYRDEDLGQESETDNTMWAGEALVIPAGGNVQTFGLGQVENKSPQILVPGLRNIRQGDFCTLRGRRYQIKDDPGFMEGYMLLRLEQYQQ